MSPFDLPIIAPKRCGVQRIKKIIRNSGGGAVAAAEKMWEKPLKIGKILLDKVECFIYNI